MTSNLNAAESLALSAVAVGGTVANLLSPGGATSAAVSDILAAATSAISLVNTANAALSNFTSPTSDPIAASFSTGQPFAGTFITSPQVTQITPINFSQALSSSTQALSQLSTAQQSALSAQTGVTLTTDADLATAMASVFSQAQSNFQMAFSINLNTAVITPIPSPTPASAIPLAITIPPLTMAPNITNLTAFVAQVTGSFPNTPGIAGVAASIWIDGLGVSVSGTGIPVSGVPAMISSGVLGDISTAVSGILPDTTPITVVDFSFQQNQFNLLVGLAIDHGLTTTVSGLMTSPLVTPSTFQVIKNRLLSVAQRGDTAMLATLFTILGRTDIPSPISLLITVLSNLRPNDQPMNATATAPSVTASGIAIMTTSNALTTSQIVTDVNTMLTLLGITIQTICSQNTCNRIIPGQTLINVPLLQQFNRLVLEALLGIPTVQLALIFA
jgi:hypothetical protein